MRNALAFLVLSAGAVAAGAAGSSPAATAAAAEEFFTLEDFDGVPKVDLHAHIHARDGRFVEAAKEHGFRFVNIATFNSDPDEMRMRHETVFAQLEAHPDRVIAVSSFPMDGWDDPDWAERTIRYLDETFERGAVGVKLWKNIGMESKDREGKMIMVDDPKLDPVLEHLVSRDIPVIGHLGEPRECWLPLEQMVMHKGYFSSHPEYHMFLHPEMPSYEDQLSARDHLLEKHPKLRFAAAHMASLEWSIDELAAFLDRFPDVIVETAARVRDLQYQSSLRHDEVRQFMIDYQDRIAYGTDLSIDPDDTYEQAMESALRRWHSDWTYFATDGEVKVGQLDEPVRGLKLPRTVIEKLYSRNTERFFRQPWGADASGK